MIVIPICGEGRRFSDVGYKLPKFRLPVGGRIVLEYVINSFPSDAEMLIVVNSKENADYLNNRYNNDRFEIQCLSQKTKGQAHTVELCLRDQKADQPLTIFNCDTAFITQVKTEMLNATGCYIDVTQEEGDHWSFVEVDEKGDATRVVEKVRISENTSTGLYHFGSISQFLECCFCEKTRRYNTLGEQYVAPLFNHLIDQGFQISVSKRETSDVLKFGTPHEYHKTKKIIENT